MTRLETVMERMTALLQPPWTWHWWPYVKDTAAKMAADDPALAQLPAMVEAEYRRLQEKAKQSSQ